MKRLLILSVMLGMVLATAGIGFAADGLMAKEEAGDCAGQCATIPSGELYTADGELLTIGYNEWGYNYQGRSFNGDFCDYHPTYRPGGANHDWCVENYGDVKLIMGWNDAWLSNTDCDGDGTLDRHYGHDSYIGSGAWETNTMTGTDEDGTQWAYFVKIAAKPTADYECEEIWGSFCVLMEVYSGEGASFYEDEIGFGAWD